MADATKNSKGGAVRWLVKVRSDDGTSTKEVRRRAHPRAIEQCRHLTFGLGPGAFGEVIDMKTQGIVYAVRVTLGVDGGPLLTEEKL